MKKLLFCYFILIAILFSACDKTIPSATTLSGVWNISSLNVNGEEYINNEHLLVYAPDIAKSTIAFGENNTFNLSVIYAESADATGLYELSGEIHSGTYTLDGKEIQFNATKCDKSAKEKSCQFRGEIDGKLLRISKSFSPGDLWMIPITDKAVAINVIFQLKD